MASDAAHKTRWLRAPLGDDGSAVALVRALWPLLGVEAPAPDALPPRRELGEREPDPDRARWSFTRCERRPCPYAGGSREETRFALRADDRSLVVQVDEIIWVGLELFAEVRGPSPWADEVLSVLEGFVRASERSAP